MNQLTGISRPAPSRDEDAFDALLASRANWTIAWEHVVPANHGYGFTVTDSQAWRLEIVEMPQIVDMCVFCTADPSEHLHVGSIWLWEGGHVTRGTRLWGTPPQTRVLATCTADTLCPTEDHTGARDHVCHGAHCNPHHWVLYTGRHQRTCYDNLRAGMAMLGHSQRQIHDNLNLFQRTALDPRTGQYLEYVSDAERGDYVEFRAHVDLSVVISLCPQGSGPDAGAGQHQESGYYDLPTWPVRVVVLEVPGA